MGEGGSSHARNSEFWLYVTPLPQMLEKGNGVWLTDRPCWKLTDPLTSLQAEGSERAREVGEAALSALLPPMRKRGLTSGRPTRGAEARGTGTTSLSSTNPSAVIARGDGARAGLPVTRGFSLPLGVWTKVPPDS